MHRTSGEWMRKGIHLATALFPLLYQYVLNRTEMLLLCTLLLVLLFLGEVLRTYTVYFKRVYIKTLGFLLRKEEETTIINGATYLMGGLSLSVLAFPTEIAIISMWVVILADTAAALVGTEWGRHRLGQKSFEGTGAFIMVSMVIMLLFGIAPILALSVSFILALVELIPGRFNDNLILPMASGVLLTMGQNLI